MSLFFFKNSKGTIHIFSSQDLTTLKNNLIREDSFSSDIINNIKPISDLNPNIYPIVHNY